MPSGERDKDILSGCCGCSNLCAGADMCMRVYRIICVSVCVITRLQLLQFALWIEAHVSQVRLPVSGLLRHGLL